MHTKFDVRNFVASPVEQSLDTPCTHFSKFFNEVSFACKLLMYRPKLKSVNLPVLDIIAIGVLGALQSSERGT